MLYLCRRNCGSAEAQAALAVQARRIPELKERVELLERIVTERAYAVVESVSAKVQPELREQLATVQQWRRTNG